MQNNSTKTSTNQSNCNIDTTEAPQNINPVLYSLRQRLFNGNNISLDTLYELVDQGFSLDEILELINYCQDNPECLFNYSNEINSLENNPSAQDVFNYIFPTNFHFIHIIINFILSFLATFSLIYLICHYHSKSKILSAIILTIAYKTLISPLKNEVYSTNLDEYENSQTRCFSITILSIGLIFLHKYDINYCGIDFYLYFFLITMIFDIAILEGFIGLPRTVIHWFLEFINRYIFGFSGCPSILYGIIQFLIGSITVAGCSLFLHFYKNVYWTRGISFFLASFICKIELSKTVCISAIIHSIITTSIFIVFNRFLLSEKNYNLISIIQIGYYAIFEFLLPFFSSISPYLFVYVQLFESNKVLKYIRMIITSISLPILIGSLLTDDCNYILTSIIIVHSNNRYFSEPYIFGLAIFIARFTLYYDFEMESNLPFNLLIGLMISRKFFSLLPLMHFRQKLSIDCTDIFSLLGKDNPFTKSLFMYIRTLIFPLTNCLLIPAFFWSFITGAPINFFYLHYLLPQPSPPRCNAFWDHPKEKINITEHPIESFVYYSYLQSFKKSLFDLIKKGKFGVIDENSFLLFLEENYTIILHIISLNSFSVDFQIRCSEFVRKTLCHAGELGFLNSSSQNNYLRNVNMEDTPTFLQSVFTPVAQNVELNGYHHYPIDIKTSFLSLTYENKSSWMSYAICFFFSKHKDEFEINEFFDNPIPEINLDENSENNNNNNGNDRQIQYHFVNRIVDDENNNNGNHANGNNNSDNHENDSNRNNNDNHNHNNNSNHNNNDNHDKDNDNDNHDNDNDNHNHDKDNHDNDNDNHDNDNDNHDNDNDNHNSDHNNDNNNSDSDRNNNNSNHNNNDNHNDDNGEDSSDSDETEHAKVFDGTINYDFKKSIKTLDEEAFSQFEFGDFSYRINNFLNIIYKEVNRKIDSPLYFFQQNKVFAFSQNFPLFNVKLPQANNDNNNNDETDHHQSENDSDVEIDNRSDSEVPQNQTHAESNEPDVKKHKLDYKKVEWLIKESAKRTYLYWCLAGSYLSPDLEEKGEIRDFLEETEEEYVIIESNSDKWKDFVNLLRSKNNPKKKKKKEKEDSNNEVSDINESETNSSLQVPKNYFTLFREIEDMNFVFIRKTLMEKWTVFRLHREYVRSIWTSQIQEVIGCNNYAAERSSMQEDNNHLHNLIIQVSDLPVEYPAYVSKIEKSYIVL